MKCITALVLVPLCSMMPLFLRDGLLVPYVVTSLAFLYFSIYLLSPLEHCSEDTLRLGVYRKLLFFLPKLDLAWIVRWKVSEVRAPVRRLTHGGTNVSTTRLRSC